MVEHEFDLHPYLAAFPALIQNLETVISKNAREAGFQLKRHCVYCQWFNFCYQEALNREDLQFLPNLSPGQLDQLRALDLKCMDTAKQWLETPQVNPTSMAPRTLEQLKAGINALSNHHILFKNKVTQLFPANISASIILSAIPKPLPHHPTLGLFIANDKGNDPTVHIWEMQTDSNNEESEWQDFANAFFAIWKQAIAAGKGPHVFSFGGRTPSLLLKWAREMGNPAEYELLEDMVQNHWTDLARVFRNHFTLPIPGELTLYSLHHVLGLTPAPKKPLSLFHGDRHDMDPKEALLFCDNLRKWVMARLTGSRQQEEWKTGTEQEDPSRAYTQFVKEEQRCKTGRHSVSAGILPEGAGWITSGPWDRFALQEKNWIMKGNSDTIFPQLLITADPNSGKGIFLKLASQGTCDLQSGFSVILNHYAPMDQTLSIASRQGHLTLNRRIEYSLEEDAEDWNTPKLLHAVKTVLGRNEHPVSRMLQSDPTGTQHQNSSSWIRTWLAQNSAIIGLNTAQKQAMELPFSQNLGLIDGPPGTGKNPSPGLDADCPYPSRP